MTYLRSGSAANSSLFMDQLTVPGLVVLATRAPRAGRVWYFEPPTPAASFLLGVLRRLRVLRAETMPVRAHVGQIRDEAGGSRFPALIQEIRVLCEAIRRNEMVSHPLIVAMSPVWDPRRVVLQFDKLIEREVRLEYLRLALIDWMRRSMEDGSADVVAIIARTRWLPYLIPQARSLGVRFITYWRPPDVLSSVRSGVRVLLAAARASADRVRHRRETPPISSPASASEASAPRASIAVRYGHTGVGFDPTERSEFFWLSGTRIPPEAVVLYDYAVASAGVDVLQSARERGVRVLGHDPGVASRRPTLNAARVFARTLGVLAAQTVRCWMRGQGVGLYHVGILARLSAEYAYWQDFYSTLGVRIHVGTLHTTVAQTLALDALGGVAVAYQYSASNIIFPTALLSGGEHVQFVFSPLFASLWQQVNAPADAIIVSGFVYDRTLRSFQQLDRVVEVRKRMQGRGAQFILCFFDENSVDRWDVPAPHEEAARDYAYLLRWLLEDPSLGIIFKPKKISDLFVRIASAAPLIDEALRTGRCEFLGDTTLVRRVFPAEAAAASDLCIGKLGGMTAALEAVLAGKRTLVIDTDGYQAHPVYAWGRGHVLFLDWPSLRKAVEQFRVSPATSPEFGDWSGAVNVFDPYQDGEAGLRIGLFIQWLQEALVHGVPRHAAIAAARERLSARWAGAHAGPGTQWHEWQSS